MLCCAVLCLRRGLSAGASTARAVWVLPIRCFMLCCAWSTRPRVDHQDFCRPTAYFCCQVHPSGVLLEPQHVFQPALPEARLLWVPSPGVHSTRAGS